MGRCSVLDRTAFRRKIRCALTRPLITYRVEAMMSVQVDIGSACQRSFTDSRGEGGGKTECLYLVEVRRLPSIRGDGWHGAAAACVWRSAGLGRSPLVPTVKGVWVPGDGVGLVL